MVRLYDQTVPSEAVVALVHDDLDERRSARTVGTLIVRDAADRAGVGDPDALVVDPQRVRARTSMS